MTEDEARTKWCSETRVGKQACGAAVNRPDGSLNCIASDCMMWRWALKREIYQVSDDPLAERGVRMVRGDEGYCGLAGPPQ